MLLVFILGYFLGRSNSLKVFQAISFWAKTRFGGIDYFADIK